MKRLMKILINCPWGPLQNFPWDPWGPQGKGKGSMSLASKKTTFANAHAAFASSYTPNVLMRRCISFARAMNSSVSS